MNSQYLLTDSPAFNTPDNEDEDLGDLLLEVLPVSDRATNEQVASEIGRRGGSTWNASRHSTGRLLMESGDLLGCGEWLQRQFWGDTVH